MTGSRAISAHHAVRAIAARLQEGREVTMRLRPGGGLEFAAPSVNGIGPHLIVDRVSASPAFEEIVRLAVGPDVP